VGPHITDFVSFALRTVLDLVPGEETSEASKARQEKRAWLETRGYRVIEICAADVEADPRGVLDALAARIGLQAAVVPPSGRGSG
jgi:tRNA/rRNA methyltransferase